MHIPRGPVHVSSDEATGQLTVQKSDHNAVHDLNRTEPANPSKCDHLRRIAY